MRKIAIFLLAIALISGCNKLRLYRVDVQQGNIIDTSVATKLHIGMEKNEVESLLGTPVIKNMFNDDTWIYVSTNQLNGGKIEKKKLILEFKNGKLVQIK